MRRTLKPTLAASVSVAVLLTVPALAETPSNSADSFLFYSRRGDATGGGTAGAVRPSLFTGGATMSVAIEAPRGTAGVQPSVALSYSSHSGRGEAGLGWSLSLPAIVRSQKYGADQAQSGLAKYELAGEELVASSATEADPYGCVATRYYSSIERYQKILFCSVSSYWVVFSKDGSYQTFGKSAAARVTNAGTSFEWRLEEVTETHGLSWKAIYIQTKAFPRIDAIQYTLRSGIAVGEMREIDVIWEPRPDPVVDYRYGMERALTDRIANIVVKLNNVRVRRYSPAYAVSAASGSSLLVSVRQYGVGELDELPPTTFEYQVGVEGFDPKPIATFSGPAEVSKEVTTSGISSRTKDTVDLNGDGFLDAVDATGSGNWLIQIGNGLGGFATAASWTGSNGWKTRATVASVSQSGGLTPPRVTSDLIDMNGDGLPDGFRLRSSPNTLFPFDLAKNTGTGFVVTNLFSAAMNPVPTGLRTYSWTAPAQSGGIGITKGVSDLVDLTGDGCPDFVRVESNVWKMYRNRACDPSPADGFESPVTIPFVGGAAPAYLSRVTQTAALGGDLEQGTLRWGATGPATTTSGLFDFNGDGLLDFIDYSGVYLGTGDSFVYEWNGGSAAASTDFMESLDALGASFTGATVTGKYGMRSGFSDVNGDGRVDFVVSNADAAYFACVETTGNCAGCTASASLTSWTVHLNTGSAFQPLPIQWEAQRTGPAALGFIQTSNPTSCGGPTDYGHTRLTDINGNGTPDLLRVDDSIWNVYGGGPEPDLLIRVSNGLGGTTDLRYAGTVGKLDGGNLHFARSVLTSQVTSDGLNTVSSTTPTTYSTTYSYSGSYYDRAKREFNGFGKVTIARSDNVGSVPSYEEVLFAVGNPARTLTVPLGKTRTGTACSETWQDKPALAGRKIAGKFGATAATIETESWTPWETATTGVGGSLAPLLLKTRTLFKDAVDYKKLTATVSVYNTTFGTLLTSYQLGETVAVITAGPCTLESEYENDDVTTTFAYAQNTAKWIFAPSEIKNFADEAQTILLSHQKLFYDEFAAGETFGVSKGDLKKAKIWSKYGTEAEEWPTSTAEFDIDGNVKNATDPLLSTTFFTYTASGAFVAASSIDVTLGRPSPITLISSSTWDERFGVATESIDPNNRKVRIVLDGLGRGISTHSSPPGNPLGAEVLLSQTFYSLLGATGSSTANSVRQLDYFGTGTADFLESRVYLDGLGRPVQSKAQAENATWITSHTRATYHGAADVSLLPFFSATSAYTPLVLNESAPPSSMIHQELDFAGRVKSRRLRTSASEDHSIVNMAYSVWDTTVTDPRGFAKLYRRDAFGRTELIQEGDGAGVLGSTSFGFDRLGRLTSITDAHSNSTIMRYDTRGLRRQTEDPNRTNCGTPSSCPLKFSYDHAGRMILKQDAKVQQTLYSYDELGRVFFKDFGTAPEPDVTFAYDGGANGLGQLQSVTRGTGNAVSLSYDNWGRVVSLGQTIDASVYTIGKTYDLFGREQSVTYPVTGEVAQYTYGPRGALTSVLFQGTVAVSNVLYDALGRATQTDWGNTLSTTATFGADQRLSQLQTAGPGVTHESYVYQYDLNGNPTRINEDATGWHREYEYDWANRLTVGRHYTGANLEEAWTWAYDRIGNMTFNSDWSGSGLTGAYEYGNVTGSHAGPSAVSRIGGTALPTLYTLTYDANGALQNESLGGWFEYNVDGRTSRAGDTSKPIDPAATFTYDGFGERRIKKAWTAADGAAMQVRYLGLYFDEERRNGVITAQDRYIVVGGQRVARAEMGSSSLEYLHSDHLGSVTLATDASGGIKSRRIYAPFGGPYTPVTSLRHGFTGQEEDREIGQIHLGIREYHFAIGRFGSPDPIIPDLQAAQSINPYSYTSNRPIRFVDPSGYAETSPSASNCGDSGCPFLTSSGPAGAPTGGFQDSGAGTIFDAETENNFSSDGEWSMDNKLRPSECPSCHKSPPPGAGQIDRLIDSTVYQFGRTFDETTINAVLDHPGGAALFGVGAGIFAGVKNTGTGMRWLRAARAAGEVNSESVKQFRHTFKRHGQGSKILKSLRSRAEKKGPQGQWLDDEKAAEFLSGLPNIDGATAFPIPAGLGHVIMPDGSLVPATHAIVWPGADSMITAFPVNP